MNNESDVLEAIYRFSNDVVKGYTDKSNPKLEESIRNLTDEEIFLLSMMIYTDIIKKGDNI